MAIEHSFSQVSEAIGQAWRERDRKNAAGARKVAIQALADVQVGSPVDTGRFKGSHFLSVDELEFQPLQDGRERAQNEAEANERMQSAEAELGAIEKIPGGGTSIFITNNLPYAGALEHGHSQQAPQGVYAVAEQRAQKNIRRLAEEKKR